MGLLHSVHPTSRGSDWFCSGLSFLFFFPQRILYSEQPWNVERVLLSGIKGRFASIPARQQ